jgi:hypothetical protein
LHLPLSDPLKLGISDKILESDLCDLATSSNKSNFKLSVESQNQAFFLIFGSCAKLLDLGKMVKKNAPVHGGRNNACYVGQGVYQSASRPQYAPYKRRLSPRSTVSTSAIVLSPRSSIRLFNRTLASKEKGLRTPAVQLPNAGIA